MIKTHTLAAIILLTILYPLKSMSESGKDDNNNPGKDNFEKDNNGSVVLVNDVHMSTSLYRVLESGIELPVYILNKELKNNKVDSFDALNNLIQIGEVVLYVEDKKIRIRDIQIKESKNIRLSAEIIEKLEQVSEHAFDNKMKIEVDDNTWLKLDSKKMYLTLDLPEEGFGVAVKPRRYDLDEPTSKEIGGIFNYSFGGYSSRQQHSTTSVSSYLDVLNTFSRGIDHLTSSVSLYLNNSSSSELKLNNIRWGRDYKGMRYSLGMLNSWSMQSLASVSGISAGDVYGFSVGNVSRSRKRDTSLTLTPIVLFFPSAGEVHIRRDGKLIAVQAYPIGNHELDTSQLPYGNYSIEVEVVTGGNTISQETHQINKPFSSEQSQQFRWQFWGGAFRQKNDFYSNRKKMVKSETMSLFGISMGKKISRVAWNSSFYVLREYAVSEVSSNVDITSWLNTSVQGMLGSDGSYRASYYAHSNLPYRLGRVWYSRGRTSGGHFLSVYDMHEQAWGGEIYLPPIAGVSTGRVSVNYNKDGEHGTRRNSIDYRRNMYSGRFGSIRLSLGTSKYHQRNNSTRDKYVLLDFSISMGKNISIGATHTQRLGTVGTMTATRQFKHPYFKSVSVNTSKSLESSNDDSFDIGVSTHIDTAYNSNYINIQRGMSKSWGGTLLSDGSAAWIGKNLVFGKSLGGDAGVIIDTGLSSDESLKLEINGLKHELKGAKNFVSLSGYEHYKLQIMNDENTMDSYNIIDGAEQEYVLYPGNVIYLRPKVEKIITLFGRLVDEKGKAIAGRMIKNRAGLTKTEEDGRFVVDIDRAAPVLEIATVDDSICALKLDIYPSQGAVWLGDVSCNAETSVWSDKKDRKGEGI